MGFNSQHCLHFLNFMRMRITITQALFSEVTALAVAISIAHMYVSQRILYRCLVQTPSLELLLISNIDDSA